MADAKAHEFKQLQKECLRSLAFAEIGSRKANINLPNADTCKWVSEDVRYRDWAVFNSRPEGRHVLWIKGKPGSGKSTLMKRLALEYDREAMAGRIISLSFFFNSRGTRLENSLFGLYRTLLFQLLQISKGLMSEFLPQFIAKSNQSQSGRVKWRVQELSDFLSLAISKKGSQPIYIFIDALDECEEHEVLQIVRFFEDCLLAAIENGAILKICLASRHYPRISLRRIIGTEILMEDHNWLDIRTYTSQELSLYLHPERGPLAEEIINRSAGTFFWTLIMVQRCKKALEEGVSFEMLKALTHTIPPDLEGLFEERLKNIRSGCQHSLAPLAVWVICTFHPLTLHELHIALAFSTTMPPSTFTDLRICSPFDKERFCQDLNDISGGLMEIISVNGIEIVQVIHESVREFLLASEKAAVLLQIPQGKKFVEYGHELITAAGSHYFQVDELRMPFSQPLQDGHVTVKDLVAMFGRPIAVPFEQVRRYGNTYLHDYIFAHINKCIEISHGSINPITVAELPRTTLEGWLVFLYYTVLETGALSPSIEEVFDLLYQNPGIINLVPSQFLRISACVNNLVIFVNKAMKDGFTLKEATPVRRSHIQLGKQDSAYLRLFWKGSLQDRLGERLQHTEHHSTWDGTWTTYRDSRTLDNILEAFDNNHGLLGLGFCLVATHSPSLTDLERAWTHRQFPSQTVPLKDWQIMEELVMESRGRSLSSADRQHLEIISTDNHPWHRDRKLGWNSITIMKEVPWRNSVLINKWDDNSVVTIIKRGEIPANGREQWIIGQTLFKVLAVRRDWELKHYSMWDEPIRVAGSARQDTSSWPLPST